MEERSPLILSDETLFQRFYRRVTRTKTVEEVLADQDASIDGESSGSLKRTLTARDLIAYGLGSTLGAGIYVTAGVAAHEHAGPAVMFSFCLASLTCLFSALCYAEFASRVPVSGSAYTFSYTCLGEGVAWFIGWNLTLEYGISASAVARGWASYVVHLFQELNAPLPTWMHGAQVFGLRLSLLAVLIIVACSVVLLMGVKESARFNFVMTIINVAIILFIIVVGSTFVKSENLDPIVPPDKGVYGIISAAGVVFFSYVGFDAVSTLAGEVKNPQRDLPIGILGTLGGATVLYVAVAIVMTGMVKYTDIDKQAPLSKGFDIVGATWAGTIVSFGSITTLTATTLCSLFGQPRIYFSMAKDGLLNPAFARLSAKAQVPTFGTVLTGIISSLIAFALDIDALANMISIGTLFAFATVCSSIVVLRYRTDHRPTRVLWLLLAFAVLATLFSLVHRWASHFATYLVMALCGAAMVAIVAHIATMHANVIESAFLCPWVPAVPCLGLFFNIYLICGLDVDSVYRLLAWTLLGFAIYAGYGMSHSTLERRYTHSLNAARDVHYSPTAGHRGQAGDDEDDRVVAPPTPQLSL